MIKKIEWSHLLLHYLGSMWGIWDAAHELYHTGHEEIANINHTSSWSACVMRRSKSPQGKSILMSGHSYDHRNRKTFHLFHHPKHRHHAKNTLPTPTVPFVPISISFSFPVYGPAPNRSMFEAIIPHPTCCGSHRTKSDLWQNLFAFHYHVCGSLLKETGVMLFSGLYSVLMRKQRNWI